jgi:hypothetical protein
MCIKKVSTQEHVQQFARWERNYMIGYHELNHIQQGTIESPDSQQLQDISNELAIIPAKLKQMVEKILTNHCTMDFNHSFCKTI